MKYNDLFIDSKLPKPLKTEEIYEYFEKMKSGDMTTREKIAGMNSNYFEVSDICNLD